MTILADDSNMAASKLEINFRRLLERCEAMAEEIQDNKENVNWRLEKVGSSGNILTKSTEILPTSGRLYKNTTYIPCGALKRQF